MLGRRAEGDGQGRRQPREGERRTERAALRDALNPLGAQARTPSVRLRRKLGLVIRPLARAYDALVEHPRLPELWPEYLLLQHQIIRATVPLTEAALARSRELDGADPLAAPLASYLEEHVDEELGHDETLLGDLEVLGFDRAAIVERMPSPAVAALVGGQYYWILHYHPVAFLGYVALMEGYPPTPELIETLIAKTGYPEEAFRTYVEHAELDPGHRDHLDRTIDALPLEVWHETALGISAIATAAFAARSLEEILDSA